MTSRVTCGLQELLCTYSKDDIRCLLRTNPSDRLTIHELMATPLVTGEPIVPGKHITTAIAIPGADESECGGGVFDDGFIVEEEETPDTVAEILPVPKSVRFLRDGVKAPRLHSIQEEVGRAMEIMRMGTDQVYIKNPTASCNNLFERRRAVHLSIPRVYC